MEAVLDPHSGVLTRQQGRSAAMLHGTTYEAEDRYRFPGAAKASRSGMRRVESERRTYTQVFGPGGDFPMASPGGAHAYEEALAGNRLLNPEQQALLEEMSDSSDEDD